MEIEDTKIPSDVTLEVLEGEDQGNIFAISKKSIIIGREQICDVKLSDEYVSNRQCQIVFRGGHFTVIDLGSLNKTKVNNETFVQKNLRDNDIISIGKTKLKFNWEAQDEYMFEELGL